MYNALMEDWVKRHPSQGRALYNNLFMKMQQNIVEKAMNFYLRVLCITNSSHL